MEPILHAVNSVTATGIPDAYVLNVDITDTTGQRYTADYMSYPDDPYGLNPTIRQWLTDHKGEYTVSPVPPPPPPPPYQLVMADFWMRTEDDDEYDAVLAAINSGSPRANRQAFNVAQTLMSNSALFLWAKPLLVLAVGQNRTDILMAQSPSSNMSRPAEIEV